MYKKVLVAFDGTESATNVLEQALVLARSENAAVDVVTVIPGYQGDLRLLGNSRVLTEMHGHYQTCLDSAIKMALARNVRAKAHLRTGEPPEEILRTAEEIRADLIVIGKRARFLLDSMPIGSVADDVIRQSDADVLVISGDKQLGLERIFLAYDGTEGADLAARQASALAARYGAGLCIGMTYEMDMEAFSLAPELEEALHRKARSAINPAVEYARRADVKHVETVIRHGNPSYKTLVEEAAACKAGLLVAGASGRGSLSHVLLGGVARRLISLSTCPVLIVKE
ncbi:universal stress protein [Desulfovibrio mangrovi]|uniref:universal stress protein n=1 Tax=Desulfovibrio mangrovi TaxID=2976983 RepID=UPI0022455424|nr:universal stress protein [Desulfovibrio mangrovi]UZP67898.1 universal stress protein [Desulfovibrio mangrovi]